MKKTYITPQVSTYELMLEGVVAQSLVVNTGTKVDTTADGDAGQLTNKHTSPWNSSNWGE